MTKFLGRLLSTGIALEGTRGTAEASADFWLPITACNHEDKREVVFNESALGTIADMQSEEIVTRWAEGGFSSLIGSNSFGLILKALLGTCSSAIKETTAYTHTYTLQEDSVHDALTILLKNSQQDLKFALGMINDMTINFEKGKVLDFSVGMMSKYGESASLTPSYAAENIFRPQDFSLKTATTVAGLGAASAVPVESLSVTFNKNLEMDTVLGSIDPQDILNKNFTIEGEFTQIYDDTTYETIAYAGTNHAVRIALLNSDVTIGATSNPEFTFDLEPCAFTEVSFSRGLNDLVKQTVKFKAMYNKTNAKIIDNFTLTNTTTAYT